MAQVMLAARDFRFYFIHTLGEANDLMMMIPLPSDDANSCFCCCCVDEEIFNRKSERKILELSWTRKIS
jgi:hypothetical protein